MGGVVVMVGPRQYTSKARKKPPNMTCDGCTRAETPKCPERWWAQQTVQKRLAKERECWSDDPREAVFS